MANVYAVADISIAKDFVCKKLIVRWENASMERTHLSNSRFYIPDSDSAVCLCPSSV